MSGYDNDGYEVWKDPPCTLGYYAVVNSLCGPTQPLPDSILLKSGNCELDTDGNKVYQFLDTEVIHSPAFLFPHFGNEAEAEMFELKPRVEWSDEF